MELGPSRPDCPNPLHSLSPLEPTRMWFLSHLDLLRIGMTLWQSYVSQVGKTSVSLASSHVNRIPGPIVSTTKVKVRDWTLIDSQDSHFALYILPELSKRQRHSEDLYKERSSRYDRELSSVILDV